MGDTTKFHCLWEYYAFHIAFACLLISELLIFLYTVRYNNDVQAKKRDYGTKWMLYGNFAGCIFISVYFASQAAPVQLRRMLLPPARSRCWNLFDCGRDHHSAGCCADFEKSFYTSCADGGRTAFGYRMVRHPAYSGSILSLLEIALAFRNVAAVGLVFFCCLACYNTRIRVEEKALQVRFGREYSDYKCRTPKLFPYIF